MVITDFLLLSMVGLIRAGSITLKRTEELITRWAPIIWLAPQEKFFPLNIESFLEHVDVAVKEETSINRSSQLPYGPGSENFYLVTKKNLDTLLQNKTSFLYGKSPAKHKVPVYAIVTGCSPNLSFHVSDGNNLSNVIRAIYEAINVNPHFHVVFWTFYPYNEGKEVCLIGKVPTPIIFGSCIGNRKFIGNHVGDWEHISLSFKGKPYPDKMHVSVHDAGAYYKYEPISKLFKFEKQITRRGLIQRPKFPPIVKIQNGRPVLFSAYGSHGIWSAPGEHYYVRVPRLIDKNGYGIAWETWKYLEIHHLEVTKKVPVWIMYKGKWGNPKSNCFLFQKLGICEVSDGPRGILHRKQDFHCSQKLG